MTRARPTQARHETSRSREKTRAARRLLRREVPSAVALLAHEEHFAAMRRYATFCRFGHDDHAAYLRDMDALLRSLASQGVHTTVALFDPDEFAEFCEETGIDPDVPDSRTRYTADVAALGGTVPYAGQPMDLLVQQLLGEVERHAALECATALLAEAGDCAECGRDRGREAYVRAARAVMHLVDALGRGTHHLVCSVRPEGTPLVAVFQAAAEDGGLVHLLESDALVFCTVLAAGIAGGGPGGIVSRSTDPADKGQGHDVVRGWALRDGWPTALSEAEVFTAYCTDADTGEPVPPEPGVDYRPGIALPDPEGSCCW